MTEQRVVEFKWTPKKNFDSWLEDNNQEGWYIKNILDWKTTVDTKSVCCVVLIEREQNNEI